MELVFTHAALCAEGEALWIGVADVEQLCDCVPVKRRVGIDQDGHLVEISQRAPRPLQWFNDTRRSFPIKLQLHLL